MKRSKKPKTHANKFPSLAAAANANGVAVAILRLAKAQNCPGFEIRGSVDWPKVQPWLAEHGDELKEQAQSSKEYWLVERSKEQALRARREREAVEGKYWLKTEIIAAVRAIGEKQRTILFSKCRNELAPKLEGLSAVQRIEILEQFANDICAVYQTGVKEFLK